MAKVLVVEDNPINMKLAVLLLHNVGHEVLCAKDAESALALTQSERIDLILMDFQLPGMDGLTASALLKQDPSTAAIPIIALTSMAIKTNLENNKDVCYDAYIAKPLRYQQLYAVMDLLLDKRQWHEEDEKYQTKSQAAPKAKQDGNAACIARSGATVDINVLKGLIGNDPIVICEFLVAFQNSATTIAQELKRACVTRQSILVGRHAHKLKSAAYAIGALELGQFCAAMEEVGKAEGIETLTVLLPLFEQELEAVNAFLDSYINRGTIA